MKFKLNDNNTKLILVESSKEEYNQLKRIFSPLVHNYRFQKRFKLGIWDGRWDYFKNGFINFGLWNAINEVCKEYGYKFIIENKDKFPIDKEMTLEKVNSFCETFYKDYKDKNGDIFYPHDHQLNSIFKILKFRYGLIEVATAGGKSLILGTTIFYYLKNINPKGKILIVLPNITLISQLYDDLLDYNEGYNKENENPLDLCILEIMSDHPRKPRDGKEPNIYLGTYQSLEKYPKEFFKQFEFVAVDESHKAKNSSITTILEKTFTYAKFRIGVSGTFPEKETAERLHIESLTGPVLYNIKAKTLQNKGIISEVKIKSVQLVYNDDGFGEKINSIKRRGGGKAAFDLEREYVHNSEERLRFIAKLVGKFKENSLVLFHSIEYGTKMYDYFRDNIPGIDFYYIDGSVDGEKRNYIKKMMEVVDGNPKVLVASYMTIGTGVSIKSLTNAILADSFKSPQLVLQSIGRLLRLHKNKVKAIIFDLVDRFSKKYENTLYKHSLERKTIYKKQEFPVDDLTINL
jgi:superfamily II DNA or RNA helicase